MWNNDDICMFISKLNLDVKDEEKIIQLSRKNKWTGKILILLNYDSLMGFFSEDEKLSYDVIRKFCFAVLSIKNSRNQVFSEKWFCLFHKVFRLSQGKEKIILFNNRRYFSRSKNNN